MVSVVFQDEGFEIDLHGIEKVETLKSRLFVPYSCVESVEEEVGDLKVGWKIAGAGLGQNYDVGRFETSEGYGFFVMRNRSESFAIHLKGFQYSVIVLDLENREEVIDEIRSHISSSH